MKYLRGALLGAIAFSAASQAAPAQNAKIDPAYSAYEKPGILAKLPRGQVVHIKCMGAGTPTVILSAGLGDWSAAWRKVQPQIAKTTRVCAWDRPGFGFSSGSAEVQTVLATTADLDAALRVAHIRGPYISVGHSLGGYEALLFKDRNPRSVVGMVLVDPSIPGQVETMRKTAPGFFASFDKFQTSQMAYLDRCLGGLKSGRLKLGGKDPEGCLVYTDYPASLSNALAKLDTNPLRFTAIRSLIANFEEDSRAVVNPRRNYGDMPLIVLTATKDQKLPPNMAPPKADMDAFHAAWERGHEAIAALSARGVNRRVPDATHYIQYDQPQAVIDAVDEVVAAVRAKTKHRPTPTR